MKAERDEKTGKWFIQYRYIDWQGNRKKSTKRGFKTKREAEEWLRNFMVRNQADFDMNFEDFLKLYYDDMTPRLRESTMLNKKFLIEGKILPYFAKKSINSISPADVRRWQNELMSKNFSETYLRTINNQLTAIFNYAVRYYDLKSNPCTKAGSMGKKNAKEKNFWTKDEFMQFLECVKDKKESYVGFEMLFWTGMRIGELLALTFKDIDFENKTITISKSYQRINGRDVITPPKTPKSNRTISIPTFLAKDIADYEKAVYGAKKSDRVFKRTKYYFEHELKRGTEASGMKRIRIHDLRHSHCSLLFEMGIPVLEVSERLGHERVETTLNIYAHIYPNKQQKISERLEELYNME